MFDHLSYSMGYYVLDDDGEPCPWPDGDVLGWAREMERGRSNDTWRVALDEVGDYRISTVFLWLDHNYMNRMLHIDNKLEPQVFETMIFGTKEYDDYIERCGTRAHAIQQHETAVNLVKLLEEIEDAEHR